MPTVVRESSSNGNGRVSESDIWDRRSQTQHPTPVGYWHESKYTIDTPFEALERRLEELLAREGNCFDAKITCDIKGLPGLPCSACPVNEVGQDTRKAVLCRLGREQERISALLTVRRRSGGSGR